MYIYIYIYIYTHTYIYIYIYTYLYSMCCCVCCLLIVCVHVFIVGFRVLLCSVRLLVFTPCPARVGTSDKQYVSYGDLTPA